MSSRDSTMEMLEAVALAGMGSRASASEPCEILREIQESDLLLLAQEQKEHNWKSDEPERMLQTLRTGHHRLAQLLAADVSVADASLMTGRSPSSIAALKADPAFRELLAYYAQQQSGRDFEAYDRLVTLGATAMDVLQERIEEAPDKFTNNELRQLVESTMDRSAAPAKGDPRAGAGKQQGLNVSINFVPSRPLGAVVEAEGTIVDIKAIGETKDDA